MSVNAVSGYTGGGKQMIAQMEDKNHPEHLAANNFLYGLTLKHKHVPEMQTHGLLDRAPLFAPSVGRFPQGMIVQVPLFLDDLAPGATIESIHDALVAHYAARTSSLSCHSPKAPSCRASMRKSWRARTR